MRTVHGSYTDFKGFEYQFTQMSSGHVFINKFARFGKLWQGLAIVMHADVFEVMNEVKPQYLQYSQGTSTFKYWFPEMLPVNKQAI